ncbi:UNVERIFIED_CONTAM: hypothetical protein Slati_2781200 [Sesamum latifolium]|uniref:Retrotransposon gag domain-containing protein n=1 Tax=Sesamum latifolium TaxID=2727402 RepID=A0AAW2VXN9_9LAMI
MANLDNGGNNGSYEGNSSLPSAAGPFIPPADPSSKVANAPIPDLTLGGAYAPAPALDQTIGPTAMIPLFCKEASTLQPLEIWQSLRKEMVELRHQVTKETIPIERGIPFNEHIMVEELPARFRAPSHVSAYNGTTNPAKHIQFSSLFQHLFASSKKYQKSAINLFRIKQEEKETLRDNIQHFNTTILKVPTTHQEVLVSAFTQELCRGPLLESLAKKPATDFWTY